jgi:phage terminase large subunit-like protein
VIVNALVPRRSDLAIYESKTRIEEGGFAEFVRQAWPYVCPKELVWNWHLDILCDELQLIAEKRRKGEPSELAICIPPGSTKSLIASVLWNAWVWGPMGWPESSWAVATYEQGLASDMSAKTRDLVKTEWFQDRWPLALRSDADRRWENARGGLRIAVGTGGAVTGRHFDFHVGDDLVKEQDSREGQSISIAAHMASACGFWFGTLLTRAGDEAVARVLIGQRLHVDDPPGIAIREHGYRAIIIPALYEPEIEGCLPPDRDPRSETLGAPLDPQRRSVEAWNKLAKGLGPISARAQLQQDPMPIGGRLLQSEYLGHRYPRLPIELARTLDDHRPSPMSDWITAWDLSFKGKEVNSRVAWGVLCRWQSRTYIVDAHARHMGFLEAVQEIRDVRARYPWITEHVLEDAANAPAAYETLVDEIPGLILEPHGGGTLARTQRVLGLWAAGDVLLPEDAEWVGGSDGFVAEHLGFDGLKTRRDDYVSMSSLGLCRLYHGQARQAFDEAMQGFGH